MIGRYRIQVDLHLGRRGPWLAAINSLLLLVLLAATSSLAQTTSTITGTITDNQGLVLTGAEVHVTGTSIVVDRTTTSDASGVYQIAALPAGTYKVTVSHAGFRVREFNNLELTLNRTLLLDAALDVGTVHEAVRVTAELPLLETQSSSTGNTIMPQDITNVPLNGRDYLDLLQVVPGVAINPQYGNSASSALSGSQDNASSVMGERGGNTSFLIDGLSNSDELNGGAAAQFNQETIAEFQVITMGYAAEFGHASGGVVNVITKSGADSTHGVASAYRRDSVLDSSDNALDVPYLARWDYSLAAGGPIVKDKIFWFGSGEEIHENRQLNFVFPPDTPQFIQANEDSYDQPNTTHETRFFGKLDEIWGRHRITEEMNYTNLHIGDFLPLLYSTQLPSTRGNIGMRTLLWGFSDTALLGGSASPYILNLRGQYRNQPSLFSPSHPDAGPNTLFYMFSGYNTGGLYGDLGQISFGSSTTPSNLDQKYGTFGASLAKTAGRHTVKFGWDFERTQVDGAEANAVQSQLWALLSDYETFGPIDSGFFLLKSIGGATPTANQIHLRNNYHGLFVQDDWKIRQTLMLNLGLRWDYDSRFGTAKQVSPRLGFAWAVTSRTVVRGSWGRFYDHFRLGIARDIPGFGGADLRVDEPLSYPRLFFGVPTIAPALFGLCLSQTETDAQLGAGATCPYTFLPSGTPIYGVDHLNNIVAAGHAPIPSNTVVNQGNIENVSGLTPQQYADQASQSIGQQPGFFFWGPYGALSYEVIQPSAYGVTIDPRFATPYTDGYTLGVQHQIGNNWSIAVDYYHKDIRNILGVRQTNIPFEARIANDSTVPFVNGYGPWYSGTYDAGIVSFEKRVSHHFSLGGSFSHVSEHDDALCSGLSSSVSTNVCYPTDSYVGNVPVVTDPGAPGCPSQTNAKGAFWACNGNYVPKANTYWNGPSLDKGPSDLALRNTFEVHGLVELPWKIQFSSLFRAQSGFPYTMSAANPVDQDGNGNYGIRDLKTARNQFLSPRFVNMDMRVAKTFAIGERVKIQGLFEFFNLLNNGNPAAVQINQLGAGSQPFGAIAQTLPGREGQVGLRIEF